MYVNFYIYLYKQIIKVACKGIGMHVSFFFYTKSILFNSTMNEREMLTMLILSSTHVSRKIFIYYWWDMYFLSDLKTTIFYSKIIHWVSWNDILMIKKFWK